MASAPKNVCVHCGCPAASIFVQYSPGNIRLSSCDGCKRPVDEYVECENLIIVIDLILLKPEAFRHVFFNHFTWTKQSWRSFVWRACTVFLVLDILQKWRHGGSNTVRWDSIPAFATSFGKLLVQACAPNILYVWIACLGAKFVTRSSSTGKGRNGDVILALLMSSFFKLYAVATLVWEFTPTMIAVLELLAMSANIVALKVMLKTSTSRAAATIVAAALGRGAATWLLQFGLAAQGV